MSAYEFGFEVGREEFERNPDVPVVNWCDLVYRLLNTFHKEKIFREFGVVVHEGGSVSTLDYASAFNCFARGCRQGYEAAKCCLTDGG